jgi:ribosomal protein L33
MKKLALALAAVAALGLTLPVFSTAQAQDADKVVIKKNNDASRKKVVIKKHSPAEKKVVIHKRQPANKKVIIKKNEG